MWLRKKSLIRGVHSIFRSVSISDSFAIIFTQGYSLLQWVEDVTIKTSIKSYFAT